MEHAGANMSGGPPEPRVRRELDAAQFEHTTRREWPDYPVYHPQGPALPHGGPGGAV